MNFLKLNFEKMHEFLKINQKKVFAIFAIYCIGMCSIGIVNYPYIDDTLRRLNGSTGFATSYSRFFSEYAAYLVQGSRHLTDLGLTTFILSALIMTAVSLILLYIYQHHKEDKGTISWLPAIASVFIGLNPWFLSCISFRFDNPYMCLSVLVSVVPFLFFYQKEMIFFAVSALGIFLMCNSYQASSGIYLVVFLTMLFLELLNKSDLKSDLGKVIRKCFIGAAAYIAGMLAFAVEMKFNPYLAQRGDIINLAPLKEMPRAILRNLYGYFETYKEQCSRLWICIFVLIIAIFILQMLQACICDKKIAFILICVYLLLASVLSYGAYMLFSMCLARGQIRYAYGLAFFVGCLLILLGETRAEKKYFPYMQGLTVILSVYYTLSFVFAYANVLESQKESFESYSAILAGDLNPYLTGDNKELYLSKMCGNSKIYGNALVNYPILAYLVPNNELIYWPNTVWFNTLTDLNVNVSQFDFSSDEAASLELLESDKLWNIYGQDDKLYVQWK